MSLILEAAQFAAAVHSDQFRRFSKLPYVTHLIRVAGRVSITKSPIYVTDNIVAAAWLHDTIEDQPDKVDEQLLKDKFGPYVAKLVVELTNTSKITHPEASRADRKELDHQRMAGVSIVAKVLRLEDRIDNMVELHADARWNFEASKFLPLYQKETLQLLDVLVGTSEELEKELRGLCAR